VAVGCIFDGNNRRPSIMFCSGRWLNTTDSVNTDHSDGTKMERWRNWNVTHSVNSHNLLHSFAVHCLPRGRHSKTFLPECYKHFSLSMSTSALSLSPIRHYPSNTRWPTLITKLSVTQHPELHNTILKRDHIKMLIISSSSPPNH